jgi:hypothetical protein
MFAMSGSKSVGRVNRVGDRVVNGDEVVEASGGEGAGEVRVSRRDAKLSARGVLEETDKHRAERFGVEPGELVEIEDKQGSVDEGRGQRCLQGREQLGVGRSGERDDHNAIVAGDVD